MTTVTVIFHKPCQNLQTDAVTLPLITTLIYISQTLAKVLFKNNPNIRISKGVRILGHWSPGTINYFTMEPNYSDCYAYTQHSQFTCTEHKVTFISHVHKSRQKFSVFVMEKLCHHSGAQNWEVVPSFLEKLSTSFKAAIIVQPIGNAAKCKISNFSVIFEKKFHSFMHFSPLYHAFYIAQPSRPILT